MERKIGETFEFEGKTYKVIESKVNLCTNCSFGEVCGGRTMIVTGNCISTNRFDKKNVIFKEVKNMEIKDNKLTIDIPEGMEIDIKNSDLKEGIIKFEKKKVLTYKEVYGRLNILGRHIVVTPNNIQKLIAIDKLLDIARYYNGDWKPDWSNIDELKFLISYDNRNERYIVDYNTTYSINAVHFKHKEDALAVIDNPNFREILDAIFKN